MKSMAPTHSGAVYALLADLWPVNGYAILPEVGNGTGANAKRHADAVVVSLWPSRGLTIHGVEIKVSRSDWLTELRQPEKADAIAGYCDGWYVAVSERKIVGEGELPPTWGLIACDSGKAKIVKAAPSLTPKPLDRSFVAAMLRRAATFTVPEQWRKELEGKIWENCSANVEAMHKKQLEVWQGRAAELEKRIADFETETGFSVRGGFRFSRNLLRKVKDAIDDGSANLEWQATRFEVAAAKMREAAALLAEKVVADQTAGGAP